MAMTMTQKILAAHAGLESVRAGQLIMAKLDMVLGNDITSPVAINEFKKNGFDSYFYFYREKKRKRSPARLSLKERGKEKKERHTTDVICLQGNHSDQRRRALWKGSYSVCRRWQ